jgi:hypothetical protein
MKYKPKNQKTIGFEMQCGIKTWLPVSMAAHQFGVSSRRIRALLSAGRLAGRQADNGFWEVAFPFRVAMAMRGPQLLVRRPKKPELEAV